MWICSRNMYFHVIVQLNVTVRLLRRPKAFVMLTTFRVEEEFVAGLQRRCMYGRIGTYERIQLSMSS